MLAACATGESTPAGTTSGGTGGGDALTPFTFLSFLPLTSFSVVPEMYGDLTGAFTKNHMDMTLQTVKGSAQATQLLLANKGQVARNGLIDAMIAAFAQDQPIVIPAIDTFQVGIRIVTTDASPEPSDWVGKTIGVPSVNGTSDKTLSMSLRKMDIDPESVKRQLVGLAPGTFDLVRNGTLAGYMVSADTAQIVAKQNSDARIFVPTSVTGMNIYMTTKEQIDQHGDELKNFFLAVQQVKEGLIAEKNFDAAIKTLRSEYTFASLDDDEIANASFKERTAAWQGKDGRTGWPDMEELEGAYGELVDSKVVPSGKKIESLVDTSLLPQ
ncbi:ABC transporter substrate-binding protein [Cryobacterium sp. Hh7]|uniref:ABC transporter substrate-binding protein n=1 Tax=Cryobacterium sp. Hh7 TaxID=1259159 RepID=UPI00141BE17F|nr:ABC transporter substrate-binding protein [Cryobacterium sp. Hh7]